MATTGAGGGEVRCNRHIEEAGRVGWQERATSAGKGDDSNRGRSPRRKGSAPPPAADQIEGGSGERTLRTVKEGGRERSGEAHPEGPWTGAGGQVYGGRKTRYATKAEAGRPNVAD
eukprot:jgi/Undpi1/13081/HiC_scaffold_8.g02743.m1